MGMSGYPSTRVFHGAVSVCGVSGFYKGKALDVKMGDVIYIGRDRSVCALLYPPGDTEISKTHCKLRLDAGSGGLVLTDCSKNGTYLGNGERLIPEQDYFLADGDAFYLATEANAFIVRLL
jgi:hypothetical protein